MKDEPTHTADSLEIDNCRIVELEAKLKNAAMGMERAKAQLLPALTTAELLRMMAQALP